MNAFLQSAAGRTLIIVTGIVLVVCICAGSMLGLVALDPK